MEEEILAKAKESTLLMETVRAATTIKLQGREAERESHWRNRYAEVINAGGVSRQVPDHPDFPAAGDHRPADGDRRSTLLRA